MFAIETTSIVVTASTPDYDVDTGSGNDVVQSSDGDQPFIW